MTITREAAIARVVPPEYRLRPVALRDSGMSAEDRALLAAHIGREALQGCPDRDFSRGWRIGTDGQRSPRLYRIGTKALERCQYAVLSHPQRAAVLVLDVDVPGRAGGTVDCLAPAVRANFDALAREGCGPALVGVNPLSGKSQALWLIDPVYASKGRSSSNVELLQAVARRLGSLLGADPHFAHQWSRSPFYAGQSPHAYQWHAQHGEVDRLADIDKAVQTMGHGEGKSAATQPPEFSSGRDLLTTMQSRRQQAETEQALFADIAADLDKVEQQGPGFIDGVRVLWVSDTRAARDETAFRHALRVGFQMKAEGQRLRDATLIDAYEAAYEVAHTVGADHRPRDLPPQRDRLSMARRVRAYVAKGRTMPGAGPAGSRATPAQRKTLATFGARGGRKAAERWGTDPDYRDAALAPLRANQARRTAQGKAVRAKILAVIADAEAQGASRPTRREIAAEVGTSLKSVERHITALRKAGQL